MAATVRITVLTGPHGGARYCFRGPANCLVGRGPECLMSFMGHKRDLMISRRHCQLDIDPPSVRVQDLKSRNGTYVNGHAVGATKDNENLPRPCGEDSRAGAVQNGDIITVGGTSFVVHVVDCPSAKPGGGDRVWKEEELTKTNCPLPCAD